MSQKRLGSITWVDDLNPTQVEKRKRKLDWDALRKDVEQNPDAKLADRAQKFGVTINAIFYALKKMKITRKKRAQVSGEKRRRKDGILSEIERLD